MFCGLSSSTKLTTSRQASVCEVHACTIPVSASNFRSVIVKYDSSAADAFSGIALGIAPDVGCWDFCARNLENALEPARPVSAAFCTDAGDAAGVCAAFLPTRSRSGVSSADVQSTALMTPAIVFLNNCTTPILNICNIWNRYHSGYIITFLFSLVKRLKKIS